MLGTNNIHPMEELKGHLRQILKVIPPRTEIYYLDYPVHSNGGDLLIMKGTEAFFRDNDIHVRARYSILDCPLSSRYRKVSRLCCTGEVTLVICTLPIRN